MAKGSGPLIVVGVDGSDASKEALRWAAEYARRLDGRLSVVSAWQYPAAYSGYPVTLADDIRADTERTARGAVLDVLGTEPDVSVIVVLSQGSAAQVLVDASETADLLVVGWRGHGAFAGMLLGSVGSHCVRHARCPVVVVRPHPTRH